MYYVPGSNHEIKKPYRQLRKFYTDTAVYGNASSLICGHDFYGSERILSSTNAPPGMKPDMTDETAESNLTVHFFYCSTLDTHFHATYHATDMTVLVFVKDLLIATFGQLAALFAGAVIFGLLIHIVSHLTFKSLQKALGKKGVYLVAWLGTPIHELGHVLFCILFLHRIEIIKLFEPDPASGTLGYVTHTWNKRNPWQVLGNFFIGIGPVLLGCAALLGLFYFLTPDSSEIW